MTRRGDRSMRQLCLSARTIIAMELNNNEIQNVKELISYVDGANWVDDEPNRHPPQGKAVVASTSLVTGKR